MTTMQYVYESVLPSAYALLPPQMASKEADAMLLAIGLQESLFKYRTQIGGPARGFWQFEKAGGVRAVLMHQQTALIIERVCSILQIPPVEEACYEAIAFNDVLAACFARCFLWTDAAPLPKADAFETSWDVYRRVWRPGKPHPQVWPANYSAAWTASGGRNA